MPTCLVCAMTLAALLVAEASLDDAARAREAYFAFLEEEAMRFASEPTGEGARPMHGRWPFKGVVPPPSRHELSRPPRPIASVEWRWREGAFVESYASGPSEAVAACRSALPSTLAFELGAFELGGPRFESFPPRDDWSERGSERGSDSSSYRQCRVAWADAWIDCYEVAPGGPHLLLTFDRHVESLVVTVGGLGPAGVDRLSSRVLNVGWFNCGGATGIAFIASDFDGNGSLDVLIAPYTIKNGLTLHNYDGVIVMTDAPRRRARITDLRANGIAFIDLDRNGRAEMLLTRFLRCERCLDGLPHNFWVTELLGFQGGTLADLAEIHRFRHGDFTGRFPAFEWYAYEFEHRFRPLLDDAMRAEMLPERWPAYDRRRGPGW